jgi:hypothetical protein
MQLVHSLLFDYRREVRHCNDALCRIYSMDFEDKLRTPTTTLTPRFSPPRPIEFPRDERKAANARRG